jgi:glutathione S-transferase
MNDVSLPASAAVKTPAAKFDADRLEIVSSNTCPFAQRTRMVLMAKKLDFVFTEIDLNDKPAWFLAISPYAKVPVLRHGDAVLYESAVINEYLDEVFPQPPLLPQSALERARARIWIDFANARMVPHVYKMMMRQDSEGQDLHRERLTEAVLQMEHDGLRKLSRGPFWMGERPNLVDYTFFPHVQRFVALEHYRAFRLPDECTRLRAWIEAMEQLPEVQATRAPADVLIRNWQKYAYNTSTGTTARDLRDT